MSNSGQTVEDKLGALGWKAMLQQSAAVTLSAQPQPTTRRRSSSASPTTTCRAVIQTDASEIGRSAVTKWWKLPLSPKEFAHNYCEKTSAEALEILSSFWVPYSLGPTCAGEVRLLGSH